MRPRVDLRRKLFGLEITSIVLIMLLLFPAINSVLISNSIIYSSGQIQYISPLHTEGRYIKDDRGRIIYLRGINKGEFADDPGGMWMGVLGWNPDRVKTELDAIQSLGINVIRMHQAVSNWKFNTDNHRQHIKDLLTWAGDRGIYIVYDAYSLKPYPEAVIHPLPYPPYQNPDDSQTDVIASEDEFVEYWASVATELKNYPNVIFELWNEPHDKTGVSREEIMASWFNVAQRCIDAIRETGAKQLIIFQWNYGVYANLDFGGGEGVEWILDFPLVDPINNLVYSTHIYRVYGGCGLYSTEESKARWNSSYGWEYNEVKKAFQIEKIDWVGNTLNKPLFIGETGCDIAWSGTELEHELTAWNNTLSIFNEWGIHYTAFWWRNIGIFRLLKNGEPWIPPLTESGVTLINALKNEVHN